MKVRKLKTRIAAFGLAVLMGVSTLSSANAFAAEQTGSEQQTEVQASEPVSYTHLDVYKRQQYTQIMWKNVYDVYIENNIEKRNSRMGKFIKFKIE